MILNMKTGCLASGRVTRKGGEMTFVGDRGTPKYRFSVQVSNEKNEAGEWESRFLDCELWGKAAEAAPEIHGGDLVLCTGKLERHTWEGRDGESRTSTVLKCDFVTVAAAGDAGGKESAESRPAGRGVAVYPDDAEFAEITGEDDGTLPF